MTASFRIFPRIALFVLVIVYGLNLSSPLHAQDWVHTGSGLPDPAQKIRLAAADFKLVGGDPQRCDDRRRSSLLFAGLSFWEFSSVG